MNTPIVKISKSFCFFVSDFFKDNYDVFSYKKMFGLFLEVH